MPELSVVMPTLGSAGVLPRALAALGAQHHDGSEFEVLVVADAHAPAGAERIAAGAYPGLRLRTLRAEVAGASAARNLGWRSASGEIVLFLDDDVLADPDLVAEHLRWHRDRPASEVGVLGRLRWADELRVTPFMRWLEMGIHFDFAAIQGDVAGWGRFYTCNASVKRELLERAGGFDETEFPFHYEDLDLGRRMHDHGLQLLFNRAAGAQHLKRETLESWRRRLPGVAAAEYRFVRRYPEVAPFFYDFFRATVDGPRARNRLARLATVVAPDVPLIGARVWSSFDWLCRTRLAPVFLAAWEREATADRESGEPVQP